MAESYSVKAILSAKDSGFSSTLKSASSTLSNISQKISGLAFGFMSGVGTAAFNAITSAASDLVGEINSSNKAWKTFEGNMQILGKSEDEINSVKSTLQEYATTTIYSSSDMASSYAQLAAVGIKSADKLVTGFGGLAGAAEDPAQAMKTLSQQGVQMAAKPTVAWQDFKLMLEQTPAGMAAVAKHMGMTTSELVTAIQDGTVKTETFFDAVQAVGNSDGFTKLATEYKSVDQAMDGMKETLGNKLMPAFDALSQGGISAISAITDKIGDIDGQKIADKVTAGLDKIEEFFTKCQPYVEAFKSAFEGVGTEVAGAFAAVRDSLAELNGEFGSAESVDNFKGVMTSVADAIKSVAGFITEHSDSIAKFIKLLPKIAAGFAAFKVAKTVAPFVSSFATGIGNIASKLGGGIASKLFGISGAQTQVGTTSATSGAQMLTAAKSYALMGVAVLTIAAGFALLAFSAISLANAGGPAIAVMAGLVIALVALGAGMALLLKTLAPMSAQLMPVATAMLALGAAVLLVSVGFAIMAASAVALASAGGPAIAVMFGLVVAFAAFMVLAAVLGTALTGAAVGLLAFGACVLLVGAGFALIGVSALLAATAISIIAGVLPQIAASGLQGAAGLLALGGSLIVFAVGAALAGAASIVLGAGLLICAVAVLLLAAGFSVLSVAILVAAAGILIIAATLPILAEYGQQSAISLVALGAALVVFGAGALVASAGATILATTLPIIAAAFMVLAAAVLVASVGLAIMAAVLPIIVSHGTQGATALVALGGAMVIFGAGAIIAGAGAVVFAAGLIAVSAAVIALGVAMIVLAAGVLTLSLSAIVAAGAMALIALVLPLITKNATENATALITLGSALLVFGAGATVAGAGALVLGAGLLVAGAATLVLASGILLLSAGCITLSAGLWIVTAALLVQAAILPTVANGSLIVVAAFALLLGLSGGLGAVLLIVSASLAALAISAGASAISVGAFGIAMTGASVGTLILAASLKAVNSSMKSIAKNAKATQSSLESMNDSVSAVESGLDALGDKAKSAINKLTKAFDDSADKATSSGQKVGTGFTKGMQSGLILAPAVAAKATTAVSIRLMAGRTSAFAAGAFISLGFAQGMQSQLSAIRNAAAQMAAAADKALRAKAKIHSPSDLTDDAGGDFGQGWVNGIRDKARAARKAVEDLIYIPQVATPDLAYAYSGELSSDYEYSSNARYTIQVPLNIDGKEFAKAEAEYMQDELDRKQMRANRKRGKV